MYQRNTPSVSPLDTTGYARVRGEVGHYASVSTFLTSYLLEPDTQIRSKLATTRLGEFLAARRVEGGEPPLPHRGARRPGPPLPRRGVLVLTESCTVAHALEQLAERSVIRYVYYGKPLPVFHMRLLM
jgi:hypothetical protein